ncbi:MAG: UDP-N-acetylglucosamine 1-carboxyvinyltransferase [Brevinema sp.]
MLEKFVIEGGTPLKGSVTISGAKNAALPILAATLLSKETITLHNVPNLEDTHTMFRLLESLGKTIIKKNNTVIVEEHKSLGHEAPYEIVSKMRASIAVMGPLTARLGKAYISMPGGCNLGPRPVDLHIKGIEALSASCYTEHGYLDVSTKNGLIGSSMNLLGKNGSSVLATENIMMAACLAQGTTVIHGAAKEPEVGDLAQLLIKMGAKISGVGSDTITIEGVSSLGGAEYSVTPDRIETGTFIIVAAITKGDILINNCVPTHLSEALQLFQKSGMHITIIDESTIHIQASSLKKAVDFTTLPYPLFPTDLQSQFLAYLSVAEGKSIITETIYPDRFMHAAELNRMGAHIHVDNGIAIVEGVPTLSNASVMSSDLRGGAALVIAALATPGQSTVSRIYHIDRGYENFEQKLQALGAKIKRCKA